MRFQPLQKLDATSEGITLDGAPLTKAAIDTLPTQSLRHILRAHELFKEVKPEDWDNRTPHDMNNVPLFAKALMHQALANPIYLDKAGFNPDEPRDERGRWTNGDGVTDADRKNPRFKGMDDVRIKKQKFVDAHLAAAENAAKNLNVPVENILGISALEPDGGFPDLHRMAIISSDYIIPRPS